MRRIVSAFFMLCSCCSILGFSTSFSHAKDRDFFCKVKHDIPVTIFKRETGKKDAIQWVSNTRFKGGSTPKERCESAANKLQSALDNGSLGNIIGSWDNDNPVICIPAKRGGCQDILIYLKPGTNPKKALLSILDIRGLANGKAIEQRNDKIVYLDFLKYLDRLPFSSDDDD